MVFNLHRMFYGNDEEIILQILREQVDRNGFRSGKGGEIKKRNVFCP